MVSAWHFIILPVEHMSSRPGVHDSRPWASHKRRFCAITQYHCCTNMSLVFLHV